MLKFNINTIYVYGDISRAVSRAKSQLRSSRDLRFEKIKQESQVARLGGVVATCDLRLTAQINCNVPVSTLMDIFVALIDFSGPVSTVMCLYQL